MNNKDNYKKAMNKVYASEELKRKTYQQIIQKEDKKSKISKISLKWIPTVCAVCMVTLFVVTFFVNENKLENIQNPETEKVETVVGKTEINDLPRFENIDQLKKVLKENNSSRKKSTTTDGIAIAEDIEKDETTTNNYSQTNVQVEGVDEADIVKTDGQYIYYVSNENIYIINSTDLNVISKIKYKYNENEGFYPSEIYINENKLIVLGNEVEYKKEEENDTKKSRYYSGINSKYLAKAIVYDITDKENIKQLREVALEGNYISSRMIGENIYFISSKTPYYYDEIKDDDILPIVRDTVLSEKEKQIACTDIAYFKDTDNYSFMLVTGFNINNNEKANTETFFGANGTVYCSANNLYITQTTYKDGYFSSNCKSIIYKFNLNGSEVKLQCKGEVKGDLNNQFSMDEYNGNLRIATTNNKWNDKSTNELYILDENLKQIGKLENLAKGEQIYSVRFVGKIGYVVTFKEVDPLFVVDLSDPAEPKIKGKLKIPGYSSYLHPYDETHIIGIGYNTKSNGYGGITNSSMKISMFDVSDMENPKEIFSTNIGNEYAYSDLIDNHKALFYNKEKNLIGFNITYRERLASQDRNGFILFKVDLDKGFKKHGEILQEINYETNIDKAIYIGNTLYTLSETKIVSYDLNTIKKLNEKKYN